jgi:isoleucyl-tRNA synthetase
MPFWTEEMYQNLVVQVDKDAPESIHLCDFPMSESALIDERLEREVALMRTIVSLGRAARSKANVKIRQPLSEIVIDLPADDYELSRDDKTTILEELNIRNLKVIDHNMFSKMFEYSVTPRFDRLGPKFGKESANIAAWIKTLGQNDIQKIVQFKFLKFELAGKVCELSQDDVEIKKLEKSGWAVVTENEQSVGVNTQLTAELENEGLVRELIHKIQLMRKEADFNLVDRIRVSYETVPRLRDAIHDNIDYLKSETLAIDVSESKASGDISRLLDINGLEARIVLQRIRQA